MKVKDFFLEEQEKETDLQKRLKLTRKIFHLCMEINSQGKYYAFYYLYPHVKEISVRITPIDDYDRSLYDNLSIYYDCDFKTNDEMMTTLNEVVSNLIKYLRDSDD